eukprot:10498545-Karenia_brevis.AAC.1
MDYMFMTTSGNEAVNPVLVVVDHFNGGVWSTMVLRKGSQSTYITQKLRKMLNLLGYQRYAIKCDQEPALVEIQRDVRKEMRKEIQESAREAREDGEEVQIMTENSPVGESQANGKIERAIQSVQGQIRTIKDTIEYEAQMKINPSHHIWPWLIEYAGFTLLAYKIDEADGKTPLERSRGRSAPQRGVAFGECVMYKPAKTVRLAKDEARWEYGIWLGIIIDSGENIIGTSKGAIRCRAIAPLEKKKKYDKARLEEMKGTPWQPVPGKRSNRIPTQILEGSEEEEQEEQNAEEEDQEFKVQVEIEEDEGIPKPKRPEFEDRGDDIRGMYVRREDVNDFGPTPGCNGCRAIVNKWSSHMGHNNDCRQKMRRRLMEREEGRRRVEEADER